MSKVGSPGWLIKLDFGSANSPPSDPQTQLITLTATVIQYSWRNKNLVDE